MTGLRLRRLALVVFLLLVPATAWGGPEAKTRAIDVNLFRPSPSRYALLTTELTRTADPWMWNVGLLYDFQRDPLILRSLGQRVDGVVSSEHTAHLLFSMGLPWKMEIGVELPVIVYMGGSGGQNLGIPGVGHLSKQGFGDLRLTPKIQLLKKGGFGLGFAGTFTFPTGNLRSFMGERSFNFIPKLLLDFTTRKLAFTGSIGYAFRNRAEFNGLVVGSELIWAVGAKYGLLTTEEGGETIDKLAVIGEIYGRTNGTDPFNKLNENPMVAALGLRYAMPAQKLAFTVGAARGFQGGYGAPVIQLFVGVSYIPTVKDTDGDGIPDKQDRCPTKAGPEKWEGCPDSDGDGIPDHKDRCPMQAGPANNGGCPWADTDGDGITDDKDKCPKVKGPKENKGCPWGDKDKDGVLDKDDKCPDKPGKLIWDGCPDSDGDGIPDHLDKCPTVPGVKEKKGCPAPKAVVVPKPEPPKPPPLIIKPEIKLAVKQIILPQIQFTLDSAKIQAGSLGAIEELAKLLNENTTVTLRIEGHTDKLGPKEYNLKLSQRRAESVRTYLIGKGVGAARLVAIGFGDTRLIDKTKEGRAKNRRVEFHITGGIPEGWKVKYKGK